MKTFRLVGGCVAFLIAVAAGAEEFSKTLSADDFAAAGLGKLSPAELARLDELVRSRQTTEVARAREETAARVKTETETANPAPSPSLLNRLRVVLTPGTDIEYARVETQLAGSFRGYKPGSVLVLANGQQWRVVDGSYWAPARDANKPRRVIIEPGALGSFFLDIEDGGRPKVKIVGSGR